jgi:hypothetical protein
LFEYTGSPKYNASGILSEDVSKPTYEFTQYSPTPGTTRTSPGILLGGSGGRLGSLVVVGMYTGVVLVLACTVVLIPELVSATVVVLVVVATVVVVGAVVSLFNAH